MKNNNVSSLVGLRFTGKSLDFERIEKMLRLKPVKINKRVDKTGKPLNTKGQDVWLYEVKGWGHEPLSVYLAALMKKLMSRKSAIRRLAKEYNAEIYCSYVSDLSQVGFGIPPKILKAIADCGVELSFSVFSWGGVVDE